FVGIPFFPNGQLSGDALFSLAEHLAREERSFFACVISPAADRRQFAFFPHALLWDADSNQLFANGKLLADSSSAPLPLIRPPHDSLFCNVQSEEQLEEWLQGGRDAVLLSLQAVAVLLFERGRAYCAVDLNALKERNLPFFEEAVRIRSFPRRVRDSYATQLAFVEKNNRSFASSE
ncbi:hypothetical protein WA556_005673, partial [Blastocystis sp. ATCC 50177/Nand II]